MRRGPNFHRPSDRGPRSKEVNTTGPTVDFLDVEGVLVQFVLEDQLLQIVEGLLVNRLS